MSQRKILPVLWLIVATFASVLSMEHIATALEGERQTASPLQVVTKEIAPFVIKEEDRLSGFSIDLWEQIALLASIPFEYVEVETVGEQIEMLVEGEADVGIAAISITAEREEMLDFSYSYYESGLQIMTSPNVGANLLSGLSILTSPGLLGIVGLLLLIVVIFAHFVWLSERKNNPDFPDSYWQGIWESLWYAAVTVTTVGYGDKTPKGVVGRILGLIWMFTGLFIIAGFTAAVAAQFTVTELSSAINGVEDLPGKRVATVEDSSAARYLTEQRIAYQGADSIEDAYRLLDAGQIEAIVYDAPVLAHHVATAERGNFRLAGSPFRLEKYAIALPPDSPNEETINRALLEIIESGVYAEISDRWFGSE